MEKSKVSLLGRIAGVYRETAAILLENPTIALLFLFIAVLDGLALAALFLAPSWPFSAIVAPIIRTFWSERFLHYPDNFVLLPKLFNHAHFVILTVFGVIVNGLVIKKIEGEVKGQKITTFAAAGPVFRKYFSLLAGWVICYGLFIFAAERTLKMLPGILPLQFSAGFIVSLILQALFAFVLPALLIEANGFIKNFWRGLVFSVQHFVTVCVMVALPVLLMVVLSFVKALAPLYSRSYPEAVLWVLGFGILITLIVEITVTVTTAVYYIKERNRQ